MTQLLLKLLETMNDEMALYRKMQTVLSQERDAATQSDKDQLMRAGHAKQALVDDIAQIEKRRQELVESLAIQYDIKEHPLTVSRLCGHLEAPHASRLNVLAGKLKSLIEAVQKENRANAKLFAHAMELVHGSLKLINELIYSHAVYQRPGDENRMRGYSGDRGRVFCGSV